MAFSSFFFVFTRFISVTGDQVSRRGEMTGGFLDVKRSRLELYNAVQQMQTQRTELEVIFEKREKIFKITLQLLYNSHTSGSFGESSPYK